MAILLIIILKLFLIFGSILIPVAYFTLADLKIMRSIKCCLGINAVGKVNCVLLHSSIKILILMKKVTFSKFFHDTIFFFAPSFIFSLHFITGGDFFHEFYVGGLFFFSMAILSIYGFFLADWANNFESSFFQSYTYIVFFVVLLLNVILCVYSFNLAESLLLQNGVPSLFLPFPFLFLFVPYQNSYYYR